MIDRDFLHRDLPVVGKHVHRVGLAFNFGIDGAGTEAALAAGINYLFWGKLWKGDQHAVVKAALKQDRERYVLASGPKTGEQLRENLDALNKGPLSPEEVERFRRFGRAVHG